MQTYIQFMRFVVVGLTSNAICFLFYLGLTTMGIGHKFSMSLSYIIGIIQTFFSNKKWSFQYKNSDRYILILYFTIYIFIYIFNLIMMIIFVDLFQFPHHIVQATMIAVCGVFLFFLQKFLVFKTV